MLDDWELSKVVIYFHIATINIFNAQAREMNFNAYPVDPSDRYIRHWPLAPLFDGDPVDNVLEGFRRRIVSMPAGSLRPAACQPLIDQVVLWPSPEDSETDIVIDD